MATKSSARKGVMKRNAKVRVKRPTTRKVSAKTAIRKISPKKAGKKAVPKKIVLKKAAKKGTAHKRNAAFMKPMKPTGPLAAIVGSAPMPRTEVTSKIWYYIKKNKLQDNANRRMINADEKLWALFGKRRISMFEMSKAIEHGLVKARGKGKGKDKDKDKDKTNDPGPYIELWE